VKKALKSLPPESRIFIDANIFLYSILGHPTLKDSCNEFLFKIEKGTYDAVTSTLVLNEVVHMCTTGCQGENIDTIGVTPVCACAWRVLENIMSV